MVDRSLVGHSRKKRLYCAFVDLKKAFDLIDRESLWLKLLAHGITGNVLRVVCTLYGPVTSFVRHLSE